MSKPADKSSDNQGYKHYKIANLIRVIGIILTILIFEVGVILNLSFRNYILTTEGREFNTNEIVVWTSAAAAVLGGGIVWGLRGIAFTMSQHHKHKKKRRRGK